MKPQKLIGSPALAAMPSTTTLAPAATAVALPPRSAPKTKAHHSGKLGMRDRVELTRYAIRAGLIER